MATLKEVAQGGLRYWSFEVFINGKQILAAGKKERRVYHFPNTDTMHIGKLTAPAGLEETGRGDDWYQFALGDGLLTVYPIIE